MQEKGINGQSVLLVFGKMEKNNIILAARNIPKVDFSDVYSLNPYILINHEYILFMEDALPVLSKKIINL
jgi:ribosomal protein L4